MDDKSLWQMLEPTVTGLGYELVDLEHRSGANGLLRVYIDTPQGVGLGDCEKVSEQVSAVLDVEDPVSGEYTLEVSSPGMDRPLCKIEQFVASAGQKASIRLRVAFDGRRNFKGLLKGVEGDEVVLEIDSEEFLLPFELIDKANIIPTF